MSAAVRASVIIPTWNGRQFLAMALPSLRRQTMTDFEVVVIDNGSTDATTEYLAHEYPDVRCIAFPENRGFAAAVNAGIRASAGRIIVLMNNDTEADPDWLEQLCSALDAHPDVGFCASKVVRYDDRSIIDSAGDQLGLLAEQIGHGLPDAAAFSSPRRVLTACAAAAAYRREVFDVVGLFDEEFSSYLEDVDIGVRAQLAGFACLYVPTARIAHVGSATAQRLGSLKLYLLLRNSLFLFFQYMPRGTILRWGGVMLLWPFYYALRTRARPTIAARAVGAFVRGLPRVFRRRAWVRRNRRITPAEFEALLGPKLGSMRRRRQRVREAVSVS